MIVPYQVAGSQAQIVAQYQNQTSAPLTASVATAAPGIFTADSSGQGSAAALNQDQTLNTAGNPAKIGSYVTLYATGVGFAGLGAADSVATTASPLVALPSVTIGGQNATVQCAGTAPGEVVGVLQINVQIPAGVSPGASVPVIIGFAGQSSQSNVTIAVSN